MRRLASFGRLVCGLLCLLAFGARAEEPALSWPAPPALSAASVEKLLAAPRHFGIFVQGQKVGVMSLTLEVGVPDEVAVVSHTAFTILAMGTKQSLDSTERRVYARRDGNLLRVSYASQSTLGQTTLAGVVQNGSLHLHLTQGGQDYDKELPAFKESLSDAFPVEALILAGQTRPGTRCRSRAFDPSLQQIVTTRAELGVGSNSPDTIEVKGEAEELKLPLMEHYSKQGELLESTLSGFMVLKAESQKEGDAALGTGDLIVQMSVRPPAPIKNPETLAWLSLVVSGVPENLRLNDTRQTFMPLDATTQSLRVLRETVDLTRTQKLAAIDAKLFAEDLKDETRYGLKDPGILSTAKALSVGQTRSGPLAKRLNDWVHETLKKEYSPAESIAPDVLREKRGDCGEHAVLFVALARGAGLPAREVVGLVYGESLGAFAYHAWAEVWVGRWVAVDPTFGQFPADPTHLAFGKGSLLAQAAVMGLVGHLKIEAIKNGR